MGVRFLQAYRCVVTEHGGRITPGSPGGTGTGTGTPRGSIASFDHWIDVRSDRSHTHALRFADYASLPQFAETAWRKHLLKTPPFYRRFGDILFASIALFQEARIPPCIPPNFTFCQDSRDDDAFSTLRKHRQLYDQDYLRIADTWIRRGYVPLYLRESAGRG